MGTDLRHLAANIQEIEKQECWRRCIPWLDTVDLLAPVSMQANVLLLLCNNIGSICGTNSPNHSIRLQIIFLSSVSVPAFHL